MQRATQVSSEKYPRPLSIPWAFHTVGGNRYVHAVRDERARAFREQSAMMAEELDMWKTMYHAAVLANADAANVLHEQERQMDELKQSVRATQLVEGNKFGDLYLDSLEDKSRLRRQRRQLREHAKWL